MGTHVDVCKRCGDSLPPRRLGFHVCGGAIDMVRCPSCKRFIPEDTECDCTKTLRVAEQLKLRGE